MAGPSPTNRENEKRRHVLDAPDRLHSTISAALDLLDEYVQSERESEAPARSQSTIDAEDLAARARAALKSLQEHQ